MLLVQAMSLILIKNGYFFIEISQETNLILQKLIANVNHRKVFSFCVVFSL